MSLFTFSYGLVGGFQKTLTDTTATTLVSVSATGQEVMVMNFLAAMPSGGATATVRFDLYDGSTSYPLLAWITINADETYPHEVPIYIPKGWSLRATRTAGGNIAITGVTVTKTNR